MIADILFEYEAEQTAVFHTIDIFQFERLIRQTEIHQHDGVAQCKVCLA